MSQHTKHKAARIIQARRKATVDAVHSRRTFAQRLHLCIHPKVVTASKRSRIWFEMLSALGAMLETHLRMVSVVMVGWIIVDLILAFRGEDVERV